MMEAILTSFLTTIATLSTGFVAFLVAERGLRRKYRLELMAERTAKALLMRPDWKLSTFDLVKRRLGGFDDDELRKVLVRAGAIRFQSETQGELWGLIERNYEQLGASSKASWLLRRVSPKGKLFGRAKK